LNAANVQGYPVNDLSSPQRQLARDANLEERPWNLSVHRRHHPHRVGRQAALARFHKNFALARTLLSKVAVKLSNPSGAHHRHQQQLQLLQQVRGSLAADQSEDSLPNLAFVNLQPRRQPQRVRAKREADNKEVRVHMVNLADSVQAERRLRPSVGRDNRSVERKKARGPRHQDRDNHWLLQRR
jgi:hypothetical protein